MYTQIRKTNEVPTAKTQKTYSVDYVIKLINFVDDTRSKLKLNKDAKKLLEHIEMVREARKLYSEGKIMTWEDFMSNER